MKANFLKRMRFTESFTVLRGNAAQVGRDTGEQLVIGYCIRSKQAK